MVQPIIVIANFVGKNKNLNKYGGPRAHDVSLWSSERKRIWATVPEKMHRVVLIFYKF